MAAAIRTERAALASSIATNSQTAFELTSSTVNGQTFSGTRTMTNMERFRMLGQVVAMLDANKRVGSDGRAYFLNDGHS